MALNAIEGIPKNCQILHVEQEVVGDNTTALQCVLNADVERIQLLDEEARLLARQVALYSIPLNFFFVLFSCFSEVLQTKLSTDFLLCLWCGNVSFFLCSKTNLGLIDRVFFLSEKK
jgi:hypothetical protein